MALLHDEISCKVGVNWRELPSWHRIRGREHLYQQTGLGCRCHSKQEAHRKVGLLFGQHDETLFPSPGGTLSLMSQAKSSSRALQDESTKRNDVPRDFVGSVAHGLAVLRSFDRDHKQMTLSEVSERTEMTRAGARRYLLTLAHLGYVEQNGRLFRLTSKVLELGYAFMATLPLAELAQPYLDAMTKAMGETTAIAVLEGDSVVHLARAMPQRQLAPMVTIGRHFNALFNSTGRMLIACQQDASIDIWLAKCKVERFTQWTIADKKKLRTEIILSRKNQYSIVDQESEVGVCSLAVPIKNRVGEAVAAVSVITNVATVSRKEMLKKLLPILRDGADNISLAISAQSV